MGLFGKDKAKILVIDDDRALCSFLSETLKMENYSVISTQDSKKGLDLALKHRPALIILDMYMGPPDGLEVLRNLRQAPEVQSTPVIMLTAADKMSDVEAAMQLGAAAYLTKPCNAERLCQKIAKIINGKS